MLATKHTSKNACLIIGNSRGKLSKWFAKLGWKNGSRKNRGTLIIIKKSFKSGQQIIVNLNQIPLRLRLPVSYIELNLDQCIKYCLQSCSPVICLCSCHQAVQPYSGKCVSHYATATKRELKTLNFKDNLLDCFVSTRFLTLYLWLSVCDKIVELKNILTLMFLSNSVGKIRKMWLSRSNLFSKGWESFVAKSSCNEVVKALNDFLVDTLSDNISSVKGYIWPIQFSNFSLRRVVPLWKRLRLRDKTGVLNKVSFRCYIKDGKVGFTGLAKLKRLKTIAWALLSFSPRAVTSRPSLI